jgi:hypothetical protein
MVNGIYDARGQLIKTTIERKPPQELPTSSEVSSTGIQNLSTLGKNAYSTGNYSGNIIIRDRVGNKGVFIGIR